MDNSKQGKVLGLAIQTNGIIGNASNIKNKGQVVLAKLRFINLTPKLKLTQIKTLLLPKIEYPVIPLCTISLTQKRELQVIINKALKFLSFNEEDKLLTVEELHYKYDIKPLNITLRAKARKIWETIQVTEPDHYNQLIQRFNFNHTWFPKSTVIINSDVPDPIYKSG